MDRCASVSTFSSSVALCSVVPHQPSHVQWLITWVGWETECLTDEVAEALTLSLLVLSIRIPRKAVGVLVARFIYSNSKDVIQDEVINFPRDINLRFWLSIRMRRSIPCPCFT